jgi:hypothetical protein
MSNRPSKINLKVNTKSTPNINGSVGILNAGPLDLSFNVIAKGVANAMIKRIVSSEKIARYANPNTKGAAANQYISFVMK